ncbi:MAG: hypothetical protein J7M40_12505 [Planctomycetes bacterium]|nr:hypothetical protein [Planctomycetota bacterium]
MPKKGSDPFNYSDNSDDFSIKDSIFEGNEGAAFTGYNLRSNFWLNQVVEGNTFSDNELGMNLLGSDVTVRGNTFENNSRGHIEVSALPDGSSWDYGDLYANNNIFKRGSSLGVLGIRIDRSDYGMKLDIHQNSFIGHIASSSWGIWVDTVVGGKQVDADDNWWNHIGGPDAPDNPNPGADRVTAGVDYSPYLEADPNPEP